MREYHVQSARRVLPLAHISLNRWEGTRLVTAVSMQICYCVHCIIRTARVASRTRTLIVPYTFMAIYGLTSHTPPTFLLFASSSWNKEYGNPTQYNKTLFYKDVTAKMQRILGTGRFRSITTISEGMERVLSQGMHNLTPDNWKVINNVHITKETYLYSASDDYSSLGCDAGPLDETLSTFLSKRGAVAFKFSNCLDPEDDEICPFRT
jgi:hypothetical protein